MEKFNQKTLIVSIIVVAVSISLIIITFGYAYTDHSLTEQPWILQSYGNSVALFKDREVVEVYGEIVLDTLPEEDKRLLDNGISFLTKEEAISAIEDYDG